MGKHCRFVGLAVLVVGTLISGSATKAITISAPVRGASGYGPQGSFSSCNGNIAAFQLDPSNQANCIGVNLTTFDVNGTQLNGAQYSFLANSGDFGMFDVFDIGAVTTGSTYFVPLIDPNALTGVFVCNNGANATAFDSFLDPINGLPCTAGTLSLGNVTETLLANGIQFTFNADFTDMVLFTVDGNLAGTSSTTPEPACVALLGTGLATLIGLRRKKQ